MWFKEMSCLVAPFPEIAGGLSSFFPSDLVICLSSQFIFHLYLAVRESFLRNFMCFLIIEKKNVQTLAQVET